MAGPRSSKMLETTRLIIRPFRSEDWRDVQRLAQDWKTAPGPEFDKWPTDEVGVIGLTDIFVKQTDMYFAVFPKKAARVIGLMALNGHDGRNELDLGHVILSDHQDNDIDREVLGLMVDDIFENSEVAGIVAHNADHAAKLAPLIAVGFVLRDQDQPSILVLSRERWQPGRGN